LRIDIAAAISSSDCEDVRVSWIEYDLLPAAFLQQNSKFINQNRLYSPCGEKGERGTKGQAAPEIIAWTIDRARYRATPTMSGGRGGPPLELRGLFEQFISETGLGG
jgi:hypothetical protein